MDAFAVESLPRQPPTTGSALRMASPVTESPPRRATSKETLACDSQVEAALATKLEKKSGEESISANGVSGSEVKWT